MPDIDSVFFDITTSAQWRGHPVGIIRVERELASRARNHLGDRLSYCVYDKRAGDFKIVKDEYVPDILAGRISIDFDSTFHILAPDHSRRLRRSVRNIAIEVPALYRLLGRLRGQNISREEAETLRQQMKPHLAAGPHGRKLKTRLRNIALEIPIAYQAAQRLRGRRLSLNQIRLIRQQYELPGTGPADISTLPMSVATSSSVALSKRVAIVSGGLDWQHKEIRQIYRLRKQSEFKFISVIYDLIPLNLPQYVVPFYVDLLAEYFGELLWTSDGCLCISETTRQDLIEYFDRNGVSPPKARSFPLGSELRRLDAEVESPAALINKKYVLYVSTIEPRKNHRVVYEAWCHALLNGAIDADECRLVFVGIPGWNTAELLHEIRANPLTSGTVVIMSNVSDTLLASLYCNCAFVVFPSFYEGFGLPLAEALGYGKVCVTSGAGALREIGNGLRVDLDPRDTLGWAVKMAELLADPAKISALEASIQKEYRAVSWDSSAKVFFEAFQEITA
jgi:glycosyltransferase involved in cell wall biosynthesis